MNKSIEELLIHLNVEEPSKKEGFKGKGIKQQIEDSDCIIEYTTITREKFQQWLKDMGYETETDII